MMAVLQAGFIALAITGAAVAVVCFGAWVVLKVYDATEADE